MKYTPLFVIGLLACSAESAVEDSVVGRWKGDDENDMPAIWHFYPDGRFVLNLVTDSVTSGRGLWEVHSDSLCYTFTGVTSAAGLDLDGQGSDFFCLRFQLMSIQEERFIRFWEISNPEVAPDTYRYLGPISVFKDVP